LKAFLFASRFEEEGWENHLHIIQRECWGRLSMITHDSASYKVKNQIFPQNAAIRTWTIAAQMQNRYRSLARLGDKCHLALPTFNAKVYN
jgi:hypothetical protein